MKKIIASLLTVLLVFSMVFATAFAEAGLNGNNVDLNEKSGRLEITEPGTYVLTGSLRGSVYVNPGEGHVELVLDGVDINGSTSAGIIAVSGDSLTVTLPEGSVNRVVDGGSDATFNAAIYSAVDTVFEGDGALYVTGSNRNGIRTENADLSFNGGMYAIKASVNGLAATGNSAGTLTINAGHFSIKAINSVDPSSRLVMNGGSIEEVQPVDYSVSAGSTTTYTAVTETVAETADSAETEESTTSDNEAGETLPELPEPPADGQQPPQFPENGQAMQPYAAPADGQTQQGDGALQQSALSSADEASEVVTGTVTNSAANLEADYENATYITVTDDDSQVVITSSGTYVITGTATDGNITVKKDTTGVVLVLENLDLTSTTGATVSINKNAEVKIIISGEVVLTDNENPDDENSEDEDVADAFDGAALKAKANSQVYVTGDGTLTINGNAKNGIKGGDDSSLIFDGVTVNINAVNDGINSNYDVTLLSGSFTIAAGDDAIHADHILTVGSEDGTGPVIRVTESNEGMEATVINVYGGDISIVSADDAVNAANGDGVYEGELDYSFNMMGGKLTINSQGDGIDSNGNVNLIGGEAQISSSAAAGEAGIDYDGQLYISEDFSLNNGSGTAGPDGQPGAQNGFEQNFDGQMTPGQGFGERQPGQGPEGNPSFMN